MSVELIDRLRQLRGLAYDLTRSVARRVPAQPPGMHEELALEREAGALEILSDLADLHHRIGDALAAEVRADGLREPYLKMALTYTDLAAARLVWPEATTVLRDALPVIRAELVALLSEEVRRG